jgi:hypothetical protein
MLMGETSTFVPPVYQKAHQANCERLNSFAAFTTRSSKKE